LPHTAVFVGGVVFVSVVVFFIFKTKKEKDIK